MAPLEQNVTVSTDDLITDDYNATVVSGLNTDGAMWNKATQPGGVQGDDPVGVFVDIVYRIVLPIICACGVIGIILTVIVLSRKIMCTSTNCYLMALAIADLFFLLLLASTLMRNRFGTDGPHYFQYMIYIIYANILTNVFLLASIWLTVMLALERYIAICRPFLAAKLCTVRNARIIIVVVFLFALGCRLPNFWEHRINTTRDAATNASFAYIYSSEFSFDEQYMTIYPWVVDGVITSIVPFLSLLVLNARLIWEVRKSTKYIKSITCAARNINSLVQKEEIQITVMLISVVIVFFVCQGPYVIYTAIVSINKYAVGGNGFVVFNYCTIIVLVLKSAINFILYCWFSEKFWATFKFIFCMQRCMYWRRNQNGSYYNLRRLSTCTTRITTI